MSIIDLLHIAKHALIDSIKILLFVFLFYVVLSFIETKISKKLDKSNKSAPLFGALSGLIPQCGISVVAADLYVKEHITTGTLLAVFIACSDEALPILLSNGEKILSVIPLIITKFLIAFITGVIFDIVLRKNKQETINHLKHCEHSHTVHIGCCGHEIDNDNESILKKHLIHPLFHSLKLFLYILLINFIFGLLIELIGEDNISGFIQANKYLSPLLATTIGLIPNCASSIIISELYLLGGIGFGATLAGLIANAGLGTLFLFKNLKDKKKVLMIMISLITISLVIGYITSLILQFK
jgi:hypothetical protein